MSVWAEIDALKRRWDGQRDALVSAIKEGGVFSCTADTVFCLPNGKWRLTAKTSSLLNGAVELYDSFDACLKRARECTKLTLAKEQAETNSKKARAAQA